MNKYMLTLSHALMGVGFAYVAIIAASKFYAVVLAIGFFAAAWYEAEMSGLTTLSDRRNTMNRHLYDDRFFTLEQEGQDDLTAAADERKCNNCGRLDVPTEAYSDAENNFRMWLCRDLFECEEFQLAKDARINTIDQDNTPF